MKKLKNALISVYRKEGLEEIVGKLSDLGIKIYSTGGTLAFINDLGFEAISVEDLTGYPSIFGGRVKTLHPKVFGGILARRTDAGDSGHGVEMLKYGIPEIDLVIVDLYPFEKTVLSGASEEEIIEQIDIGGISLIRAAAKNHKDVLVVSSADQYGELLSLLLEQDCSSSEQQRRHFAAKAFMVSSGYDAAIFNWFNRREDIPALRVSCDDAAELRYGENPHQKATFFGHLDGMFDKLHGKDLSYNNLLDVDAAVSLISDLGRTEGGVAFAILKHNNACGAAVRSSVKEAWETALSCDPVSAFGGVLICSGEIDAAAAAEIDKLFFEVIIAPSYGAEALETLKSKKNRIILALKETDAGKKQLRTVLNGIAVQDRDALVGGLDTDMKVVTEKGVTEQQKTDLIFANIIVKHSKSNAIVLAKDRMLLASGVGQTSRVDALKQAIAKAGSFGFDLRGAAMASDAYFPFADCVEIAHGADIDCVIQPGGSIRDGESIDYCNANGMSMVFTGTRHFKH